MPMWISEVGTSNTLRMCHSLSVRNPFVGTNLCSASVRTDRDTGTFSDAGRLPSSDEGLLNSE